MKDPATPKSVLESGSNVPGEGHDPGHCVVFLGKTLNNYHTYQSTLITMLNPLSLMSKDTFSLLFSIHYKNNLLGEIV